MIFHHSWALTPLFLLHLCSFVTHPARQCFTYVLCDMDSFHREPSKRLSRPVLSECVCTQYVDCFVFVDDVVKRCVLFSISIDINVQGWASLTAGHARGLAIHGLTLASRSEGSRHRCVDYIGVCKHGCNIYIYSNLIALIFFPRRKAVILIKKTIRAALAEAGEGTVLVQCAGIHVLLHSWFSQYYLLAYPGRWCGWPSRMRSPSGAAGGTIYIYIIYEYVDIYIYISLLVCDALESLEH